MQVEPWQHTRNPSSPSARRITSSYMRVLSVGKAAIVMPGASFAGKTTMVRAWLEAGATYYSDEFAVLDRTGRVHPFARPLAIREGSTASTRRVPAGEVASGAVMGRC